MTGNKEGLRGLKAHAQGSFFKDWHVTPEMKASLLREVRRAERAGAVPQRPWRTSPAMGLALAALGLVIGLTSYQGLPGDVPGQGEVAQSTEASGAGSVPLSAPVPLAPPAPTTMANGDTITFTLTDALPPAKVTLTPAPTGTVTDYDATVSNADTYGNTLSGTTVAATEVEPGRKIVLNADYLLQVKDAPAVVEELQRLAVSSGGYVVEASVAKNDDASYSGRLVLRIPALSFSQAVQQIRRFGEVKQEKQWSQDVTDRYADLGTRIGIQQEMEQKLQELALKAATFDDWLKLTRQINETRAQIESMQGSLKQLENQVEYSTVTVALTQPSPDKVEKPASAPTFWQELGRPFLGSLNLLGRLGKGILLALSASLPFLASITLMAGGLFYALRSRRRREP